MVRYKQTLKGFVGEISQKGYVNAQVIGATFNLKTALTNIKTNCPGTFEVSGEYRIVMDRFGKPATVFAPDMLDSFKPDA